VRRGSLAVSNDSAELVTQNREVHCEDAIAWLERIPAQGLPLGSCVITGIPDIHEVDSEGRMGLDGWQLWFEGVVELILTRIPENGIAIFMQTDVKVSREAAHRRKANGSGYWQWVDKSHLVLQAASRVPNARLLWHKIIHSGSSAGGGRTSSVAGYTHFLCLTTGSNPEPFDSTAFPDVCRKGLATWVSGSGAQTVEHACSFVKARGCSLVVDPFCGEGAVLAVANVLGMASLGVDHCAKRARLARSMDGHGFLANDRAER